LLVSQTAVRVEHYRREACGSWRHRVVEDGDRITLASGSEVAIDSVYDGAFDLAAG